MRLVLLLPLLCLACAAAPASPAPADPATAGQVTAALGQTVRLGPVSLTPVEVVEDSRCPTDVRCVWAGRLRLQVRLSSETRVLQLNAPCAGAVALTAAVPAPSAAAPVPASAYRFTFSRC